MKIRFEEYKEKLFSTVLSENYHDGFLALIDQLHKNGNTRSEIYFLFLEFHAEIQTDPGTADMELVYDNLSDFMDGFTDWGKTFRILPNAPES
ncbi:MAG: hypothetical protein H6581_22930 [Bacteroidia bacterium]|nr:hypothetical protein [Bacteroidia bacterium]